MPRVRLGVAGWPVRHSLSPRMHAAALAHLGLRDWRYQHLPLPPDLFEEAVRALPRAGFAGINVTIPHKEAALALADEASVVARAVGAANTLTFSQQGVVADNTDVTGLLQALPIDPRGRECVVLGAGGAGRAAVYALVQAGASFVGVWNRTPERARAVAQELGATAVERVNAPEILVNTTSVGLDWGPDPFKALPIGADTFGAGSCVVDMVYRPGGTTLTAAARSRGSEVVDGVEVLVAQGAASLERWTGRPAPHVVMREAVEDPSRP